MDSGSSPHKKAENDLQDILDQEEEEDEINGIPNYNLPANAPPTIFNVTPPSPGPVFGQPVGPKSMTMTCPHCHCRIETNVRYKATAKTHIACLLLAWTCCCCCLPYCMDTCQNANHFCPMCGEFIGTYAS